MKGVIRVAEAELGVLAPSLLLPNRSGPVPLWYQIASGIIRAIDGGELPAGALLESERAMCDRLGVSRLTVRRAIQDVVDKGLLVRRRGVGTRVVRLGSGQHNLTSLFEELQAAGRRPSTKVLELRREPCGGEVAERLGLQEGSAVFHIQRVRFADGAPIGVLHNYLPGSVRGITLGALETDGLYSLMRSAGVVPLVARQHVGARGSTSRESLLLAIERGAPVLTVDRIAFNAAGEAIEHGLHCYRPDRYSLDLPMRFEDQTRGRIGA